MEYFYTPPRNIASGTLTIDGEEFAHLTHVMRKHAGDAIRVVDGVGHAFDVTIEEMTKRSAQCSIRGTYHRLHEPHVDVTIAVGLLKNGSSFDFLVEKCTELGVNMIVPLITERTIPRHAKTDRWQKIALAAMKQSERCVLPSVKPLMPFHDFIIQDTSELKIIPHEKSEARLVVPTAASITICIGPEGGFTDGEIAVASDAGFTSVSLGIRRLRTETAAITAVARMLVT